MFRSSANKNRRHDPRIEYRGVAPSRLNNLTDAVFGIAITLLIFNLANPNSFEDLLRFTKVLPACLISIAFIFLIWKEQRNFSKTYVLAVAERAFHCADHFLRVSASVLDAVPDGFYLRYGCKP